MADDVEDLDAFFDDIAKATEDAVDEQEEKEPVSKKQKTQDGNDESKPVPVPAPAPPFRPRGVVVAAASSYKATPSKQEDERISESLPQKEVYGPTFQPPPPPLPSPSCQPQQASGPATVISLAHAAVGPQLAITTANTKDKNGLKSSHVRIAGGKTWVDSSLDEWPNNDFRIFVGNLANDVGDAMLFQHFTKFSSCQRAKVVRDLKKGESKGYGFVSFGDAIECARAIREMDQTWLGSRPIRIKRSTWKDREIKQVRQKERKNMNHQKKMGLL